MESLLPKCIESLLNQTVSNFEIILIDDGSLDSSGMLCDMYAQIDTRIRVFHLENKGVSFARNKGLNEAKGEYVVFVDSDDYIDDSYIESLLQNDKYDLVISGYRIENSVGREVLTRYYNRSDISINDKNSLGTCFVQGCFNYAVAKRFRASIINNNNIRFNETLSLGEDTVFVLDYLKHCQTISVLDISHYHYVWHQGPRLTDCGFTKKELDNIEKNYLCVYDSIIELFDNNSFDLMKKRMGVFFKPYVNRMLHTEGIKYSFFRHLFKQSSFRITLEDVGTSYSDESDKYRSLLKMKSPFLFWLYYKIMLNKKLNS